LPEGFLDQRGVDIDEWQIIGEFDFERMGRQPGGSLPDGCVDNVFRVDAG
jgi:hypothetical protein